MYDFLREFIILFFFSQIFSIIFIFLQSITFNAKRIIAKVNMIDLAVSGSIFFFESFTKLQSDEATKIL